MTHRVRIEPSGRQFDVADGSTVLAAGLAAGVPLQYNCRSGFCMMCKGRIIAGGVSYDDIPLETYLSASEREAGYALLCQARARSDLIVEATELNDLEHVRPRTTPCRIFAMERVAPDVMIVRLRLPINENLRYQAGQHLSIALGADLRRDYSIANACRAEGMTELELHVRHLPGGAFTDRLFSEIKLRSLLTIEVPLGTVYLHDDGQGPVLLLTTGTGFAPAKAMIEHAIASGLIARRPVTLYWGGRTRRDLYMFEQCERWASDYANFRFAPVLSRPSPECRWSGRVGHVQDHAIADIPDLSSFEIHACGSPAMVRDAQRQTVSRAGADPARFHADAFTTAADKIVQPALEA